jgi:hypothetical protein
VPYKRELTDSSYESRVDGFLPWQPLRAHTLRRWRELESVAPCSLDNRTGQYQAAPRRMACGGLRATDEYGARVTVWISMCEQPSALDD